jgi:hypothetical protein
VNSGGATGLDPAVSCVKGKRSDQLNYASGFEREPLL